jgi:hypothetical protein
MELPLTVWRGRRFRFVRDARFILFSPSSASHPRQPESCTVGRARVPYLVGQRLPRPCHFPARIQSFQAVATPFPGDSGCPQPLARSSHRQKRIAARQRESQRSAARPCTISCRSETSETIPFPGTDSIFSSGCGAISRRLRVTLSVSRRDPGDRNASVQKIDDRLGDLRRDGATGTNIEQRGNSGKNCTTWRIAVVEGVWCMRRPDLFRYAI